MKFFCFLNLSSYERYVDLNEKIKDFNIMFLNNSVIFSVTKNKDYINNLYKPNIESVQSLIALEELNE